MAANQKFFKSYWPRFKVNNSKEFLMSNDVSEATELKYLQNNLFFELAVTYEKVLPSWASN